MNLWDILILLAVAAAVLLALWVLRRGRSGCCGSSGCSGSCQNCTARCDGCVRKEQKP